MPDEKGKERTNRHSISGRDVLDELGVVKVNDDRAKPRHSTTSDEQVAFAEVTM